MIMYFIALSFVPGTIVAFTGDVETDTRTRTPMAKISCPNAVGRPRVFELAVAQLDLVGPIPAGA